MSPGPTYGAAMLTALMNIQQLLMYIDQTTKQTLLNSKSSNTTAGGLGPGSIGSHPGGFFGNLASGIGNGILNQIAPKLQNLRGQISQIMAQTYSTRVKNKNFDPTKPEGPGNQQYKTVQHDISMAKLGQILSLTFTKGASTIVDAVKNLNSTIQDIGSGGRSRIADQVGKYGAFSPSMQNSIINYEFANMMRQMKSGEELAPSFDALVQSQIALDDSTRSLKVAFEKFENQFWTGVNNAMIELGNVLSFKKTNFEKDAEETNKKLQERLSDMGIKLSDFFTNPLLPQNQLSNFSQLQMVLGWEKDKIQSTLNMLDMGKKELEKQGMRNPQLDEMIKQFKEKMEKIEKLLADLVGKTKTTTQDSARDVENKIEIAKGQHLERKQKRREDIRREHERAQDAQR